MFFFKWLCFIKINRVLQPPIIATGA